MKQKRPIDSGDCLLLAKASRHAAARDDFLGTLETVAARTVGHRLFTVSLFHPTEMELERVYSSMESAYGVGGRKAKGPTPWTETVLVKGDLFLGRDEADIRAAFDDHETIIGLGLGSIINVPVRLGPAILGTMNLTHERGWYDDRDLDGATVLGAFLAPWLCMMRSGR